MVRPVAFLLAVLAFPTLCAAQSWPATAASGAQNRAPQASVLTALAAHRPSIPQLRRPAKRMMPPTPAEAPKLEVRAKAEWFDDQGMRFNGKGITYKQRF